jgi:hypothetical protein
MSGRSRTSFSSGTKLGDALTKKTKTRSLFSYVPRSQERVIDSSLAQTIADQYGAVFAPSVLNRISSKLVGKFRTSGAINPKPSLFHSRLNELQELQQSLGQNPQRQNELVFEAANTMLSGGKNRRSRQNKRSKRSKQSKRNKNKCS